VYSKLKGYVKMASLALGLAGAAIGGTFGSMGSSIGWMVGSYLGATLFADDIHTEGPRLQDLKVTSSAFGAPIPTIYGTYRVAGNVIWSEGLKETAHTQDVGGKGGPSQSHTSYTYSCSFAVGLCEGEITGIRKIWADSILIYNKGDTATGDELAVSNQLGIAIYTGSETQESDPTIEASVGVGNTPAYRGLAYIVFTDLQLEKFGNRIPNITCEVVEVGSGTYKGNATDIAFSRPSNQVAIAYLVDVENDTVYWKASNWQGVVYDGNPSEYMVAYDLSGSIIREAAYYAVFTADTFPQSFTSWRGNLVLMHPTLNVSVVSGSFYDWPNSSNFRHVFGTEHHLVNNSLKHPNATPLLTASANPLNGVTDGSYLYLRQSDPAEQNHGHVLYKFVLPSSNTYDPVAKAELDLVDDIHDVDVSGGYVYVITHPSDGSSGFTIHKLSTSLSPVTSWYTTGWHPRCQLLVNGNTAVVTSRTSPYYAVYDLSTATPVVLESGQTGVPSNAFSGGKTRNMLLNTHFWINVPPNTIAPEVILLEYILTDLCSKAGIASFEASAITNEVKGYVRTGPMTARAAMTPLMNAYNITAAESDFQLKFEYKDASPDKVVDVSELAASVDVNTPKDPLGISRIQNTEIPRRITVAYASEERDYGQGIQYAQRIKK
jgi:hypothetical protein